jgi:hypothetical protein
MNTHLVSFGDTTNYGGALTRILVQSSQWQHQGERIFKTVNIYNENHLMREHQDFWSSHKNHIQQNRRGYGYWIWKSFLVKHVMDQVAENDVVLWIDAGCQFNTAALPRFREYIDITRNSGICCFDVKMPEYQWTKLDTALRIVDDVDSHMNTGQLITTAVFFLNNSINKKIVTEWYDIGIENSYHYITDAPSAAHNMPGFAEHRHDQSILSLLIKKYNQYVALPDETYFKPNWKTEGLAYPIWATRNPSTSII